MFAKDLLLENSPVISYINKIQGDDNKLYLESSIVFRCPRCHTYFEPNTVGGWVQKAARELLGDTTSCAGGFVHVMEDRPGDPVYTQSWQRIINTTLGCQCVLMTQENIYDWSSFVLPEKNGGVNEMNKQARQTDCVSGPNKGKFKISESHYLRFEKDGMVRSRKSLLQEEEDGVNCHQDTCWNGRQSLQQQAAKKVTNDQN